MGHFIWLTYNKMRKIPENLTTTKFEILGIYKYSPKEWLEQCWLTQEYVSNKSEETYQIKQ